MNITLNDTITVNNAAGNAVELNITGWTPEFIAYGLAYFHGVRMQRCTASAEKVDWTKVRQAMFDSMAAGEMPSGGGGGPQQTPEKAGRIAYYNSKGSGVKVKGQVCTGKNLAEYDALFTKKAIWDELREMMQGMSEAEQRKFITDDVPGHVQDNLENVLSIAMADTKPAMMGDFIESEKRKRNGTIAPTGFKVKMIIKPK
jgi:hypothetical protein